MVSSLSLNGSSSIRRRGRFRRTSTQHTRRCKEVSVDEVIEFLSAINEQKLVIPDVLKNLLDKLGAFSKDGLTAFPSKTACWLMISSSLRTLSIFSKETSFGEFITSAYQKEIQKLLNFKSLGLFGPAATGDMKERQMTIYRKRFQPGAP